jgi:hypothetical protein
MPKNTDVFTLEEISLAKSYMDKWDKIVFSTQPIDRDRAAVVVKNAYKLIELPMPKLFFLPSPPTDFSLFENPGIDEFLSLKRSLHEKLLSEIEKRTGKASWWELYNLDKVYFLLDRLDNRFEQLCNKIYLECSIAFNNCTFLERLNYESSLTDPWVYDLHINYFGVEYDLNIWNTWKSLCKECPYLLAFENCAIVIDRPRELHLDAELMPHVEGKAAIKFSDGYELYCNHGTLISEKYGKIMPTQWQAKSIITERNSEYIEECKREELFDILIRNIGHKRFCQELPQLKDEFWQYREQQVTSVYPSLDIITSWQLFNLCEDFYHEGDSIDTKSRDSSYEIRQLSENNLPFKLPKELIDLHQTYRGEYQLAPGLYFYSLITASFIQEDTSRDSMARFPIFKGDRDELYYVRCDHVQRPTDRVYCVFPGGEPMVYAECVTSLIMTIAECYREGAYYTEDSREIQSNLDKIEIIFEKFNPKQIENWRKVWRS